MSEKDRTRRISPMFGFLALIVAFGTLVLVTDQPAAADTFTSINTLVGAVTLGHFTSLNLTTSGNTITLGINLAHSNVWSSSQTFQNILASSASTYSIGTSASDWSKIYTDEIGGANSPTFISFDRFVGSISVWTSNGGTAVERMSFGWNNPQGSAGITSYEPFSPNTGNTLSLGSMTNFWSVLYVQVVQAGNAQNLQLGCNSGHSAQIEITGVALLNVNCSTGTSTFQNGGEIQGISMPFSVYHASGNANPTAQLGDGFLKLGAGGGTTLGININYCSTALCFSMPSTTVFKLSTTGIGNTQGFQTLTCTLTNPSTSTNCSLPITEPDTSYYVTCSPNDSTVAGGLYITGKTTTQFTANYPAIAVGTDSIDCIVTHQ